MSLNNPALHRGSQKLHNFTVKSTDLATFESGPVHPVCSTFALAREAEWAGRLFILQVKQPEEEGIGTFVEIRHNSPAFEGETVSIVATAEGVTDGELLINFSARVGTRLVATGRTGQRLLPKEKITALFERAKGR